jgi:hypothetical protein
MRSARHERGRVLGLATRLRAALGSPRALGAERELEAFVTSRVEDARSDVAWLECAISMIRRGPAQRVQIDPPRVAALIVLGPG